MEHPGLVATTGFLLTAIGFALKALIPLGAAWLMAVGLGRASAATRHLVWVAGVAGALALPVLSLSLPTWKRAAAALGQIRDRQATSALARRLRDPDIYVRERAAAALSQLRDPKALDALLEAVTDAEPGVRRQAVQALADLRNPRSLGVLIQAARDEDPETRERAVSGLSDLRDPQVAAAARDRTQG